MRNRIIAAALAATLLGGGALAAQNLSAPPPGPLDDSMLHADADKDGTVTRDELLADVTARFAKVDADKDGKITAAERGAMRDGMRGHHGRHGGRGPGMRADADGDGIVTLDEQKAQALKIFGYVDRNADSKVDQAERSALRETMMAMRGPGGPGHHRGPPPPEGAPPPPPAGAPNQ